MALDIFFRETFRTKRRTQRLQKKRYSPYKGTKSTDFTTTDLPFHGDYGYQTTAAQLQFNCNGAIRKVTTSA